MRLLTRVLWACLLTGAPICSSDAKVQARADDLHEQIVQVPEVEPRMLSVTTRELSATVYRPEGDGPFPLLVLNHDSSPDIGVRRGIARYRAIPQIRVFVQRGFAVIVPIRRGYGATGGDYAEDYFSCRASDYMHAATEASRDVLAAIHYAQTLPFVDPRRVVVAGYSGGGFAALATAAANPPGLIGAINFSGGRGGNPVSHPGQPCSPERMLDTLRQLSARIHVPVLWDYALNDRHYDSRVVKSWFAAFTEAGGRGTLIFEAPFGSDGHDLFDTPAAIPLWQPRFDAFIANLGLAPAGAAGRP